MPEHAQKKILVADDSPTAREILKGFLEKEGFQVTLASDGIEAIEKTYAESPDLLILDITMPRMKGYQACRFLKRNKVTSDIPIIMLTVKMEKEDVLWGKDSGAEDYLNKDILSNEPGFKVLLSRIQELIQGKEAKNISGLIPSQEEILSLVNDLLDEELRKSRILALRLGSLFELSNKLFFVMKCLLRIINILIVISPFSTFSLPLQFFNSYF